MIRTDILLAEDNSDDFNFFAEALEKLSPTCRVSRVKSGLDCITFLKSGKEPSVIFLDLKISHLNGLECLRFIKNSETLAKIPVIICSTSHYIKDIDAAYKNGAQYYIVKPGDAGQLAEMLTTVFDRLEQTSKTPRKEDFVVRKVVSLQS